jgi:fatty acid omega-hydroxylase
MVADSSWLTVYRDTTAQALSWTFFHLIQNPEVVAKMRVEIEQLTASNEELVDYSNYKQFTYNLAVFYEALRLHPSVPKVSFSQRARGYALI